MAVLAADEESLTHGTTLAEHLSSAIRGTPPSPDTMWRNVPIRTGP
jgi:hypothetical protein